MIKLPIEIGDTILTGKFRNHRVEVKTIETDELGQPTINGNPILKIRIEKLMKKESNMNRLERALEQATVLKEGIEVTFTPHANGYVSLSAESGTAVYQVVMEPNGDVTYAVNGSDVAKLPNTAYSRELLVKYDKVKDLMKSYLHSKSNDVFWKIKDQLK